MEDLKKGQGIGTGGESTAVRIEIVKYECLEYYAFNFFVHSTNTRNKVQLNRLIANFALYQRDVYYVNMKIFNTLPASTAEG